MRVHSALPDELAAAVEAGLGGLEHVAHGPAAGMRAAEAAAADAGAIALIGPFRSRAVAEAVEATAPAGLSLLAPVATWAGVTRTDEPGCEDDPADHRGTVLRIVARDTEVAARIAEAVRAAGQRALVVAGAHEYGEQLDRQLDHVGLPRVPAAADADLLVLCGLAGEPEVARATARRCSRRCASSGRSTSTATRSTRPCGSGTPPPPGRSRPTARSDSPHLAGSSGLVVPTGR